MSVLLILVVVSLVVAIGFLAAFVWASRSGQFEDDLSPSVRMLMDDEIKKNKNDNYADEKSNAQK